jgi:hypothetical protein
MYVDENVAVIMPLGDILPAIPIVTPITPSQQQNGDIYLLLPAIDIRP